MDAVSPGDRVTGVVQVQQVELDNSVERVGFESRFGALETDEERAALLADRLYASERRARELQGRAESNRTAERSVVAAEIRHLRRVAERSRELSDTLPSDIVEANGIPEKLQGLNERLDALGDERLDESLRVVDGEDEGSIEGLSEMDTEFIRGLYDDGFSDAPGVAKSLFGNKRMNVRVETVDGGTGTFYLETEGGEVVDSAVGERKDATLRVETHEDALRRISRFEESSSEFADALRTDEIEYRGLGALSRLKYGIVAAAQFVAESVGAFLRTVRIL